MHGLEAQLLLQTDPLIGSWFISLQCELFLFMLGLCILVINTLSDYHDITMLLLLKRNEMSRCTQMSDTMIAMCRHVICSIYARVSEQPHIAHELAARRVSKVAITAVPLPRPIPSCCVGHLSSGNLPAGLFRP